MAWLLIIFSILMCFTGGRADYQTALWSYFHAELPNTPMPDIIKELTLTAAKGPVSFHGDIAKFSVDYRSLTVNSADLNQLFLKKDLHPGAEMKKGVNVVRVATGITFLPRAEADSMLFSSTKLAEILDRLSVAPGSELEKGVENTLRHCEAPAARGEKKLCATSLESMIDFVTSELGNHDLKFFATKIHGKTDNKKTTYIVAAEGTKVPEDKLVACHPLSYPYAVFYCHVIQETQAYVVPLAGKDGTMVSAVTVCHSDTSDWNPMILKALKPGKEPICHFMPQDAIVWARSH